MAIGLKMTKEEIQTIVKEYIIDNLEVNVETSTSWECDKEYNTISVEIKLGNEIIHSDEDSVRIN